VSGRSGGGGLVRPGNRGGFVLGRRVSDVWRPCGAQSKKANFRRIWDNFHRSLIDESFSVSCSGSDMTG
jgi:hypothetical protein